MKIEYDDHDYFDYGRNDLRIFYIDTIEAANNFYKQNQFDVADMCFKAIKTGIKYDLLEVSVFRFNIGGRLATVSISRDYFDFSLKKCIEVFEKFEEYEKCAEALSIIKLDPFQKETSR